MPASGCLFPRSAHRFTCVYVHGLGVCFSNDSRLGFHGDKWSQRVLSQQSPCATRYVHTFSLRLRAAATAQYRLHCTFLPSQVHAFLSHSHSRHNVERQKACVLAMGRGESAAGLCSAEAGNYSTMKQNSATHKDALALSAPGNTRAAPVATVRSALATATPLGSFLLDEAGAAPEAQAAQLASSPPADPPDGAWPARLLLVSTAALYGTGAWHALLDHISKNNYSYILIAHVHACAQLVPLSHPIACSQITSR
jgi:hypothetical protein